MRIELTCVASAVEDHLLRCFCRTTGEFELLVSASPYLYPFIVEYLMLVMECVADWFFSDARRHQHAPAAASSRQLQPQHVASAATNDGSIRLQSVTSFEPTHDQQQEAHAAAAAAAASPEASSSESVVQSVDDGGSDDDQALLPAAGAAPCPRPWCLWLGLDRCPPVLFSVVMPLVASFLFVVFGIYSFLLGSVGYRNVFVYYRVGYWLLLSLAALVGYIVSREFPSATMNPNGFEYFVILSCVGPILQSVFTIVANVRSHAVPTGVFLAEEITNVVHICVQVVFYAYAKSVRIRTTDLRAERRDGRGAFAARCKLSTLRIVISSFALCNFAIWVEDSFIETRNSETSWQKLYFDKWPIIYNIFNPLALVFRFNSVLLFLDVLFEKGR